MIVDGPVVVLDAASCRSLVAAGVPRLLLAEAKRHGARRLPDHLQQLLDELERVAMSELGRAHLENGRGGHAEEDEKCIIGTWESCSQAATRLRVSQRQIRRLAAAGALQARKNRGAWEICPISA